MFLDVTIKKDTSIYLWLQNIYGIGPSNAKKVCHKFNYSFAAKVKSLSDFDLFEIKKYVERTFNVDSFIKREVFLNIVHLKKIRTYRGLRHYENLPVRGQRTHTNAQTQKKLKRSNLLKKS